MTLELVNSEGGEGFSQFMDITLDNSGKISTVENLKELEQSCCKAVVTSLMDDDGYGTNIKNLRGSKNIYLIKGMTALSILSSLQNLKAFQFSAKRLNRINNKAILGTVDVIQTQVDQQRFAFFIQVRSSEDLLTFEEATELNVTI